MAVEIKVPSAGESITEVLISAWLKSKGDHVRLDETLAEIETDKATMDLPSPVEGTLTEILKNSGETVKVGDVIGRVEPGVASPKPEPQVDEKPAAKTPAKRADQDNSKKVEKTRPDQGTKIMPAARRVLAENSLLPAEVEAAGPSGRLLKEDVVKHLEDRKTEAPPQKESQHEIFREEEIIPMTPLRRTIAERLVQAQQVAALLTTFNEIDMSSIVEIRKGFGEAFQTRYGVKLGFMSFFVKAAIEGLKQFPQINAEIRGTDIVYKNYFDIGIAIGGGKGLVVPVLRNAERMSFAEIELAIGDFGRRVKENKIKLEELQGGTFTISNGGIYGSLLSTPIVNPPQSGILGLHAIQDRPVVRDGQIVIRPMMYVALTYDHRIVDGREAVTFLRRIKEDLEAPSRILIEV